MGLPRFDVSGIIRRMIRFPDQISASFDPFQGTTLDDWVTAPSVYEAFVDSCTRYSQNTALSFIQTGEADEQPVRLSYAGFLEGIIQAANLLRSLGIARGDGVAYMLPSLIDTQLVLWGAETAGIAMPINFLLQPEQIVKLLAAGGAKVLVAFGPVPNLDIWQKALAIRELMPELKLVKVSGAPVDLPGVIDFATARPAQAKTLDFADRPGRQDIAAYFHTGGTTGQPKLVAHTHENQLAGAYGAAVFSGATPSDVLSNGFPMFHVAGTIFCSLGMFLAGSQILLLSGGGFRNPNMVRNYWRIAERYLTFTGGIPTALSAILQTDSQGCDFSRVRGNISGGAALPRAVAEGMQQVTGKPMREVFGMTEAGGVISVDPHYLPNVIGSVGLPIPFCKVEVRRMKPDGVGEVLPRGEPGVFVLQGPNVTPGYRNPEHNAGAFTDDGWLISGDVGYMDGSGHMFITTRAKDVIIRSGHNIDPRMIEEVFLQHPAVADAAAVSMPDGYAGELPVAYVVLKKGAAVDPETLRAFVEARINERPAYPKRIFMVDSLPVTGVGKVFKPALRCDCAERLFREELAGEPVKALAVSESARRGMTVRVTLNDDVSERDEVIKRLREKLKLYLIDLVWA